jgi:hypothetical protein
MPTVLISTHLGICPHCCVQPQPMPFHCSVVLHFHGDGGMDHSSHVHSPVGGYLSYLQLWAVRIIFVHVFGWTILISFALTLRRQVSLWPFLEVRGLTADAALIIA